MTRLFVLAAVLTTGSIANADHGVRGTVTAYELDGHTVIEHRACLSTGRHTYDYFRCGERLRDAVKLEICRKRGSGTHHYLFQVGDGRPSRFSVFCGRRY
jgi:hypothetical protein